MSDVLVVASKVKNYIKEKGSCNTAGSTMEALTVQVTRILDRAIENAKSDGRKTVMEKDVISADV